MSCRPMLSQLLRLLGSALLTLISEGCVTRFDPDTMQPRADAKAPPVYEAHTAGQTFVAARPRLCAIEVFWQAPADIAGPIVLHLRSSPADTADLARTEIDIAHQRRQTEIHWRFPPLPDSQGQEFYLLIEAPLATADHPLRLHAVAHDVYTPGSAYTDGQPWSGDLTFRAFYDYDSFLLLKDLGQGLKDIWLFLPAAALFWAPGFLLLQLWPAARRRFDGWEQVALALGLSLATVPFLLLWLTQLGGVLRALTARVLFGGLGVIAVVVAGERLRRRR